ncbi:MAG TPA: sorbosone dehydrogenase family protein [Thermoanaerobaculia bacterium]|nr:sorbosone dehydrogenase family protein [Thermoanaerobaculia bacterium]
MLSLTRCALTLTLLLTSCAPAASIPGLHLDRIELPPGFSISLYSSAVPGARSMTLSPRGILYVGTRGDKVFALVDSNDDHKADKVYTIASGLDMPNGVAWHRGSLYVAEVSRVWRYDDIDDHLAKPPKPVLVSDRFPNKHHHGWKFIRFGPDDKLYVPIGAPCNICDPGDPYASITRMNADGSDFEIFARGIRNSVGFDWNPTTGVLWFTDNGRDWLGDDEPPDELNRAPKAGMNFGYPFCHGGTILDPKYGEGHFCAAYSSPAIDLGPHVAALGMRFYTGTMFPPAYRGQIFIAEHGSWNRSVPIGYRVILVKVAGGKAVSKEIFASGWLGKDGAWGRPVDVQQLPDGSLLISDDLAGAIYRISYSSPGS